MLRWLIGVTRDDKIRNGYIKGSIRVVSTVDKMRENRFRWFGHVMRKESLNAVTAVMEMNVEGRRGRKRPKKKWFDAIGCDMKTAGVCIDDVGHRVK